MALGDRGSRQSSGEIVARSKNFLPFHNESQLPQGRSRELAN
jgi:hypothetical protein